MHSPSHDTDVVRRWTDCVQPLVEALPTASRPKAMAAVRGQIVAALTALEFQVEVIGEGPAPILVARRPGQGTHVLGLAAHYDVEECGEGWSHPAGKLIEHEGRIYGRGTGDNLGPLALRLTVLSQFRGPTPPLVWVIQGEEEVGSATAHHTYPDLELSDVSLWLEETGYFEHDGSQRLLAKDLDTFGQEMVGVVRGVAESEGRSVVVHERYLNKAFGQNRCPFLVHLAVGRPYLAIGPNDPDTRIHDVDESLPLSTLGISARQFEALLTAAAN